MPRRRSILCRCKGSLDRHATWGTFPTCPAGSCGCLFRARRKRAPRHAKAWQGSDGFATLEPPRAAAAADSFPPQACLSDSQSTAKKGPLDVAQSPSFLGRFAVGHRRCLAAGPVTSVFAEDAKPPKGAGEKLSVACVGVRGRGASHYGFFAGRHGHRGHLHLRRRRERGQQGRATASPRSRAASRSSCRTCARSSTTSRSTSSPSPRRTTGTPWPRSGPCRPARTSTSRSRSATTSAKAAAWSRRPASTSGSARPARSAARMHGMRSRRSSTSRPARSARSSSPAACATSAAAVDRPARATTRCPPSVDYDLWCGPAPMLPLTRPQVPLRLALAVGLRQRRPGQPGHPPDGHRPLGPGRRRPRPTRCSATAAASATRTPARRPTRRSSSTSYGDKTLVFEVRGLRDRAAQGRQASA